MPVDLESAASSLSEQTKKLQIALYYTDDDDKAKKMVSGSFLDLYLIKGKFSSSNVYGAFVIFLNFVNLRVANVYSIISRSYEIAEIKTNQEWRTFEARLVEVVKKGDFDEVMTSKVNEILTKSMGMQEITQLSHLLDRDNGIAVNHNFQRFFSDVTGFQKLEFSVDYEKISSLSMELYSATSEKISNQKLNQKLQSKAEEANADAEENETDDPLSGKDVRLLVKGSLILSPIKGRNIAELAVGDIVMISVFDDEENSAEFLKAFNAYNEDGTIKPISGRIISVKHTTKYEIYAIVAKGVYVRIIEVENFIKVAMDPTHYEAQVVEDLRSNKTTIYIISGLAVLFLASILLLVFILFSF